MAAFDARKIGEKIKTFGREARYFLTSVLFLKSFGKMLAMLLGLFLLTIWLLRCYTHHGQSLQVHDYREMQLSEAVKLAKSRSFRIVVDSTYRVGIPPLTVIDQSPAPLSMVKKKRTIYLTVTRKTPDMVLLPKLTGFYHFDQYARKLSQFQVKLEVRERQFNNKYEENTILYLYNGDERITEDDLDRGVQVPRGMTLEAVVTERAGSTVSVPDMICTQYSQAEFVITGSQLVIGTVQEDQTVYDRGSAYVYKQNPAAGSVIRTGQQVDVFLTQRRPASCPADDSQDDTDEDDQNQ